MDSHFFFSMLTGDLWGMAIGCSVVGRLGAYVTMSLSNFVTAGSGRLS